MMATQIRTKFKVVLLIGVLLALYKVYYSANSVASEDGIPAKGGKYEVAEKNDDLAANTTEQDSKSGTKLDTTMSTVTVCGSQIDKAKRAAKPGMIQTHRQTWKNHQGSIFYREIVPKGEAKLDVLLLHGHSFTSENWVDLKTMDTLAAAGFHVVALDLPDYGKSKEFRLTDNFRGGLVSFLDTFLSCMAGIEVPVIVSPSASGRYSLPYVLQKKVRGYMPIAIVGTEKYAKEEFKSFKAPTLIMRGSKDTSLGKTAMDNLKQAIPHSTTTIIEDAGHACYLNQPEAFHKILLEFLNDIASKKKSKLINWNS